MTKEIKTGHRGRPKGWTKPEEKQSMRELLSLFRDKMNVMKLAKRIESGKYSAKDKFAWDILKSDKPEARIALFKKIYPDSIIADIQTKQEFEGIRIDK